MTRSLHMGSMRVKSPGFTLLEVMIALGVLATTLVVLLGLRNRDIQIQSYARELTEATLLARNLAFQAEQQEDLMLGYTEGDFGEGYPGYSWQQNVNTFMFERVLEVNVAVFWSETDHVELTHFVETDVK